MNISEHLFTILVDNKKFVVTRATLLNYPESLLTKLVTNKKNDQYVAIDGNTIYIDRDPESFTFVINFYRGYKFDIEEITDNVLKSKVIADLRYFGLYKDIISLNLTDGDEDNEVGEILKTCSEEDNQAHDLLNLLFNKKKGGSVVSTESTIQSLQDGGYSESGLNTDALLHTDNKDQINELISNINDKLNSGNPFEIIQKLSNDTNMIKFMNKMREENQHDEEDLQDLPEISLSDESKDTHFISSQVGGKKLKTRFVSID